LIDSLQYNNWPFPNRLSRMSWQVLSTEYPFEYAASGRS
jgi:hypothetical protein